MLDGDSRATEVAFPDAGEVRATPTGAQPAGFPVDVGAGSSGSVTLDAAGFHVGPRPARPAVNRNVRLAAAEVPPVAETSPPTPTTVPVTTTSTTTVRATTASTTTARTVPDVPRTAPPPTSAKLKPSAPTPVPGPSVPPDPPPPSGGGLWFVPLAGSTTLLAATVAATGGRSRCRRR